MKLNADQLALLKWITAGLLITGVRKLDGDAGYLLNNMIAKYTLAASEYRISERALAKFKAIGTDLSEVHKRSKFYGKNSPFLYEHAIPATIVRDQLLRVKPTQQNVLKVLRKAGPVVVVLREEDKLLRKHRLNQDMPEGWKWGGNPLARYRRAGINVDLRTLRVNGAIQR